MSEPTVDELRAASDELLPQVNLRKMGLKTYVNRMSDILGVDLAPQKDLIKLLIIEHLNVLREEKKQQQADNESAKSRENESSNETVENEYESTDSAKKELSVAEKIEETTPTDKEESIEAETEEAAKTDNKETTADDKEEATKADNEESTEGDKEEATKSGTKAEPKKRETYLNKAKIRITPELANTLGVDTWTTHTQLTKDIWVYIHKHKLQLHMNKSLIGLDEDLRKLFGCLVIKQTQIGRCSMLHVIGKQGTKKEICDSEEPKSSQTGHADGKKVKKRKPPPRIFLDDDDNHYDASIRPEKKSRIENDAGDESDHSKMKSRNDNVAVDRSKSSKNKSRSDGDAVDGNNRPKKKVCKGGAKNQPLYRLSKDLSAVVGARIMTRQKAVSEIWNYIRSHKLKDLKVKNDIKCDDKLKRVMQGRPLVHTTDVIKCLKDHMLERLPKK